MHSEPQIVKLIMDVTASAIAKQRLRGRAHAQVQYPTAYIDRKHPTMVSEKYQGLSSEREAALHQIGCWIVDCTPPQLPSCTTSVPLVAVSVGRREL